MKNTCPFYIIFEVLKVHLIKICKIVLPDLLFIIVLISFYISRYHFSQICRTSFNIYLKTPHLLKHPKSAKCDKSLLSILP